VKFFTLIPNNTKIPFMALRHAALVMVATLILGSFALLATRGLNFALDFTGGTVAELRFERPIDLDEAREKLAEAGYPSAVVQSFGSDAEVMVRLQPREGEGASNAQQTGGAILDIVKVDGNPGVVVDSDFVSAQFGRELAEKGLLAVVFVALGFGVYIVSRFEWKFAVAAIITTVFDVIVTTAMFSGFQWEFDLAVLAGVLSVMGFSINDTIVIFDRVRESFRTKHDDGPVQVLDRAINQTLSRTVITSVVAFLTMYALFLYGGPSLEGMAKAQMFGIVIGTFSSIFVACPLLWAMGIQKQDLALRPTVDPELDRRP
jgi:preprotein translocase subunit SecF